MDLKQYVAAASLVMMGYGFSPVYAQVTPQPSLEHRVTFDDTLQLLEQSKSTLRIGQSVDYLAKLWNGIKNIAKGHRDEKDLLWSPADGEENTAKIAKFTKEFLPAYLTIIDDAENEAKSDNLEVQMSAAQTLGEIVDPRKGILELHNVGGFDTVYCTVGTGYFTQVSKEDHRINYDRSRAVVCVTKSEGKTYRLIQPIDGSMTGNGFSIGEEAIAQSTTENVSVSDAMYVDAIADMRLLGMSGVMVKGITVSLDTKKYPTEKYSFESATNNYAPDNAPYHIDKKWKSVRNWMLDDMQEQPDMFSGKRLNVQSPMSDASSRVPKN